MSQGIFVKIFIETFLSNKYKGVNRKEDKEI